MKGLHYISVAILVVFNLAGAATVTDELIGYSFAIPDNWIKTEADATQHLFEDTSGTYQSMIAIVKHDFSEETVFSSADEWTRANFISYAFSVDADPFSVMVYYDTIDAKQNETLRAADAFSQFFSIDTALSDWAEYIRYTASGTSGYEIYAIGPLEDMEMNIGYYLALIESIILTAAADERVVGAIVPNAYIQKAVPLRTGTVQAINLLGRTIHTSGMTSAVSNLMIYRTPLTTRRQIILR